MHYSAYGINRREFVRSTTAGLAVLPLLDVDALGRLFAPAPSRVALVRTTDRKKGVTDVLKLLDLKRRQRQAGRGQTQLQLRRRDARLDAQRHAVATRDRAAREGRAQHHARRIERAAADARRDGTEGRLRSRPRPALRRRQLRGDPGGRLGLASRREHALVERLSAAEARHRRGVPGVHLLPEDARIWRGVLDVAQAGGRAHAEADSPRYAQLAGHAADDRRAQHRLQAGPHRPRRRRGVHRRRAVDRANSRPATW